MTRDFRTFRATLGTTGMAITGFTRQLFWTALGAMFLLMSFSRLRRSAYAQNRAVKSLTDAYKDLRKIEEEAARARLLYGSYSQIAVEAQERLIDANERIIAAEEAVRSAIEQRIYTTWMLVFGTLPTLLRLGTEVFTTTLLISLAHTQSAVSATSETGANIGLFGSFLKLLGIETSLLAVEKVRLAIRTALLASTVAGIAIIGGMIAMMKYAEMETDRLIRKTRRLSEEYYDLPMRYGSPLEIKTRWGGWVEVPELLNTPRMGHGVSATKIDTVNVHLGGPFYIREEADIRKLTRAISEEINKDIRARGGYD